MSHVCRSLREAPCLMGLYEHIMLHIQHRVRIPDLFPVQQLYLIRPSQIENNHLEFYPSSQPVASVAGGRWNGFTVLS